MNFRKEPGFGMNITTGRDWPHSDYTNPFSLSQSYSNS